MPENQIIQRPQTVRDYLALPQYQNRFKEVLGSRSPQFLSSLVTISMQDNLARCEPRSIIGAAMIAATLDLPIEKSLGLAHIVPYGPVAQFQLGYKAYIQLAHRSGQYQRLNAKPVNSEAFSGFDEVGEPQIDWSKIDETLPAVGYVFAFKLLNGFTKVSYWSRAKVEAHAKRFSQAYKKGRQDSPWFSNFDAMALKTIVMNELRMWGILSVQMETAMKNDMGTIKDVGEEPEYVDNDPGLAEEAAGAPVVPVRPEPPKRARKGAAAIVENPRGPEVVGEVVEKNPKADLSEHADASKTVITSEVEPATEPVAPKPEEPAPVAPPTPPPAKPQRAMLRDKEQVEAVVRVRTCEGTNAKIGGVPTPSVSANVTGEFNGAVWHFGGAEVRGDKIVPRSPWAEGVELKLTLLGRINKSGNIIATVVKIESVGGASESPASDIE